MDKAKGVNLRSPAPAAPASSRVWKFAALGAMCLTLGAVAFASGRAGASSDEVALNNAINQVQGAIAPDCSCWAGSQCSAEPNPAQHAWAPGLHHCIVNVVAPEGEEPCPAARSLIEARPECQCMGVDYNLQYRLDEDNNSCAFQSVAEVLAVTTATGYAGPPLIAGATPEAALAAFTEASNASVAAGNGALNQAVSLVEFGVTPNGNCESACSFVNGRYNCWTYPCLHGGFCLDGEGIDEFTCICKPGWEGDTCDTDTNECTAAPFTIWTGPLDSSGDYTLQRTREGENYCAENAQCENSAGEFSCECDPGWRGDGYDRNEVWPTPDWVPREYLSWIPGFCYVENAGAFTEDYTTPAAQCNGPPTWDGAACVNTDAAGANAQVGSNLDAAGNAYTTQATCEGAGTHYIAGHCSEGDYDEGLCPLSVSDNGEIDQGCVDIDHCLERDPCRNGGSCENIIGMPWPENAEDMSEDRNDWPFICTCPTGPTGVDAWLPNNNCYINVDECTNETDDCDEHSICTDTDGAFVCTCNDHWVPTDPATSINWEGRQNDGVNFEGIEDNRPGCYDYNDCADTPCAHGGTCTEGQEGCLYCQTEDGEWDGNNIVCGADMKGPDSTRCYDCACAYGWTGDDCEIDENECVDSDDGEYNVTLNNCNENAFCSNTPGSYECACNMGWTGNGVECIDADDCEFSPCAHGGTCYDCGTLCFSCDCVAGWRGTTCGTDWNECLMGIHICNDDATCVNNPGSYDCRCDPGFTGDGFGPGFSIVENVFTVGATVITETDYRGCKDIDDCDPELYDGPAESPNGPCERGTCRNVESVPNQYICTCEEGFTDANCDMDINECDPLLGDNDCHRFATCTNEPVGAYTCECNHGYNGNGTSSCQDTSDCIGQCMHGFCSDLGVDNYRCTCDDGYMNKDCDFDIDECATYTHSCSMHSQCTNTDGSFTCACYPPDDYEGNGYAIDFAGAGISGTACKDVDDCAISPCANGVCTDLGPSNPGAYTCECNDGWTDFNCDFDRNECYLQTHDCHEDARCVNVDGGYFCRCLSGYAGDGFECQDIDDCDPDPCHPLHTEIDVGTGRGCVDMGPNIYVCPCKAGWTNFDCADDENECLSGSNECDGLGVKSTCTNNEGNYTCMCNAEFFDGLHGVEGGGKSCTPCTICELGYRREGICQTLDYACNNIDECTDQIDVHNCHAHASCTDVPGSFKCECVQGGNDDEWWGRGIQAEGEQGCLACTDCYDGFHEIQPCTSTTDRVCEINVANGEYIVESEADGNRMCMAILPGEWYPSRVNYGNGDELCGAFGDTPDQQISELTSDVRFLFTSLAINDGNGDFGAGIDGEGGMSDYYIIEHDSVDGYKCLFFGNEGKDIYPSLQNCDSYSQAQFLQCPWDNSGGEYCGFLDEQNPGANVRDLLIDNSQAIFKVSPLKLNERKYILQNRSKGIQNAEGGAIWECLAFEEQGAATNPSRYNWGNGDTWCGAGDWQGMGQEYALMNNKQAVFILTFMANTPETHWSVA